MARVRLPNAGASFNTEDLKAYILSCGHRYIIQGQKEVKLADHPKRSSLDFWLRTRYATGKDRNMKQAVGSVMADLVATGEFRAGMFLCPDSGKRCKGVEIVE